MSPGGVALIAAGGAAGTLARYGLVEAVKVWNPQPTTPGAVPFPAGTLAVNLLGCLAIGYLATVMTPGVRDELRTAVLVGILGGFTTFSSLAWEVQALWSAQRPAAAVVYLAASLVGGVGLAVVGKVVAGR